MTLAPTDYRAWRSEVAGRDRAYAAGYRAGQLDARAHRDRLVVLGVVAAVFLFGRRLHPLFGIAVALALVMALWPLLYVVLVAELVVRHHRRHHTGWRTAAYAASWLAGAGLVLLALVDATWWPLAGVGVLVLAWTLGPRVLASVRGRGGRGPGRPSGADPSWPPPEAPFDDADMTLPEPSTSATRRAQARWAGRP
ncbi:MAG: hypothetical protein M0Z46_06415 [Actinomycetota bacterium]|nr:hypothetical protein [Actinomycetota bacterium]